MYGFIALTPLPFRRCKGLSMHLMRLRLECSRNKRSHGNSRTKRGELEETAVGDNRIMPAVSYAESRSSKHLWTNPSELAEPGMVTCLVQCGKQCQGSPATSSPTRDSAACTEVWAGVPMKLYSLQRKCQHMIRWFLDHNAQVKVKRT